MTLFAPPRKQASVQDGQTISSDSALSTRAQKAYTKNFETHFQKASSLRDIAGIPAEHEQYRIVTEKQFNAFSLVLLVLEDRKIEELHVAIYRINQPTVAALIDLATRGLIETGSFVISNFFNQTKRPEAWARRLREWCEDNPNFKHVYVHNHAKVVALKTDRGEHLVFEGSGNMSDNARIEQYLYENSEESFLFHKSWMNELIERSKP